jgi:hypothetical protein
MLTRGQRTDCGDETETCSSSTPPLKLASVANGRERGWNPADTESALDGWVQRMGRSMAVGQQFRKLLGY